MSRYERRIFPTQDFEATVRAREEFGWVYVRQTTRAQTKRAYHAGGGTSTGGGFLAGGTTTYDTETWHEVEMYRDTHLPGYLELVRQEQLFDGSPPPTSPLFTKWLEGNLRKWVIAGTPLLFIGSLQFVAPLENWVQRKTVDWSGDQLSLFALGCIPLYFVMVMLTAMLVQAIEKPLVRRFHDQESRHASIRERAINRARRVRAT